MDPFILKWLLSMLVGIIWVAVSTTVAEKISGRLGGLLVGLPSTAVISMLFIGLTQGIPATQGASLILPASSGFYVFFFVTYLVSARKGFTQGIIKALAVWFLFAVLTARLPISSLLVSAVFWLVLITLGMWWVMRNIKIEKKRIPDNIENSPLWVKSVLSGVMVSIVVLVSRLAGPKWGGIFATLPSLTLATYIITARSGGVEFTRLIAKNAQISLTTTLGLFGIFSYYFIPLLGVIGGVAAAYTVLLAISLPFYNLIFAKLKD